jgi:hypothetical protein
MTEDYGQQSYLCVHSISKRQEWRT